MDFLTTGNLVFLILCLFVLACMTAYTCLARITAIRDLNITKVENAALKNKLAAYESITLENATLKNKLAAYEYFTSEDFDKNAKKCCSYE